MKPDRQRATFAVGHHCDFRSYRYATGACVTSDICHGSVRDWVENMSLKKSIMKWYVLPVVGWSQRRLSLSTQRTSPTTTILVTSWLCRHNMASESSGMLKHQQRALYFLLLRYFSPCVINFYIGWTLFKARRIDPREISKFDLADK